MDLLLSPSFSELYIKLKTDLPQAVVLHGKSGVGLRGIATNIAKANGAIYLIEPTLLSKASTTKRIGTDQIKDLYDGFRTASKTRRIVIVDDVDTMTEQAQNAFLKLLEEPNDSTSFILTTHHIERLLPTIRSRVSVYFVPTVDASSLLPTNISGTKRQQILFMASQLPAELTRLVTDEHYFAEQAKNISLAKQIIESSKYDSLSLLYSQKLSRAESIKLSETIVSLLTRDASPNSLRSIQSILDARDNIESGANPTLQLINAMV